MRKRKRLTFPPTVTKAKRREFLRQYQEGEKNRPRTSNLSMRRMDRKDQKGMWIGGSNKGKGSIKNVQVGRRLLTG